MRLSATEMVAGWFSLSTITSRPRCEAPPLGSKNMHLSLRCMRNVCTENIFMNKHTADLCFIEFHFYIYNNYQVSGSHPSSVCVCVCVCACVCVRACMHVCMHACMYVCMYVYNVCVCHLYICIKFGDALCMIPE